MQLYSSFIRLHMHTDLECVCEAVWRDSRSLMQLKKCSCERARTSRTPCKRADTTIHGTIGVSHNSPHGSGALGCRPKAWMYGGRSLLNTVDATSRALLLLNRLIQVNMMSPSYLRQRNPNRSRLLQVSTTRLLWKKRKFLSRGSVSRNGPRGHGETQEYTSVTARRAIGRTVRGQEDSVRCTHGVGGCTAFLVVVFELCDRCFDGVCVIMFDFAQRVRPPSLGMAHYAASSPFAATAPSGLDCAEGCLHWWRLSLGNFELSSASVLKDVKTLTREDPKDLSFFHSHWLRES